MPEDTGDVGERFQPLLHAVGIGKSFVGNRVLDGVDLAITSGEVHAIVGENGAGKSTLIKILGGIYQPDSGRLVVDGEPRRFRSPREALSAGVVVIHQELSLAPSLSAEENIFLGRFPRNAFGVIDRGLIRARMSLRSTTPKAFRGNRPRKIFSSAERLGASDNSWWMTTTPAESASRGERKRRASPSTISWPPSG